MWTFGEFPVESSIKKRNLIEIYSICGYIMEAIRLALYQKVEFLLGSRFVKVQSPIRKNNIVLITSEINSRLGSFRRGNLPSSRADLKRNCFNEQLGRL